jgi:hypothetical protein
MALQVNLRFSTEFLEDQIRNFARLIVVVLAGLMVISSLFVRVYTFDSNTPSAQALWNQREMFIFVEQNKLGWSQNLAVFLLSTAKRVLGIQTQPNFRRIDCIAFTVSDHGVEKHVAKGMNIVGAIAPYNGVPHVFLGTDGGTSVERWTGSGFAQLPKPEAAEVLESFQYLNDLYKREGWSQVHLLPVKADAEHALSLMGVPFAVRAIHADGDSNRIELIRQDARGAVQVLFESRDESRFVSAREYRDLIE